MDSFKSLNSHLNLPERGRKRLACDKPEYDDIMRDGNWLRKKNEQNALTRDVKASLNVMHLLRLQPTDVKIWRIDKPSNDATITSNTLHLKQNGLRDIKHKLTSAVLNWPEKRSHDAMQVPVLPAKKQDSQTYFITRSYIAGQMNHILP